MRRRVQDALRPPTASPAPRPLKPRGGDLLEMQGTLGSLHED
jgi:hypothetical protein